MPVVLIPTGPPQWGIVGLTSATFCGATLIRAKSL
ncbi:Uncharacterised protein [Mycobacteroides abscessus subsp. abscessus]|nr:Uncharacterised protein [Mycobacteroides abscessus subsp. abscessus]